MARVRVNARLVRREAPGHAAGVRLALYQGAGPVGTPDAVEANLARLREVAELAAAHGAHLCVFPEKFTTGYAIGVEQRDELAEHHDGPSVDAARHAAKTHGLTLVLPYPERSGRRFYDSIAVAGPSGTLLANYRKTHLYGAAERRNYSFGEELPPVVPVNGVKVGVLNCYECEFPPLYQYLAAQGAKVVVGPTAADYHYPLADGRRTLVPYPDATRHIIPAMACVWRLFVAYANRRGWEDTAAGSWQYRGNSGIWGPDGEAVLAAGDDDRADDTLLIADCVPAAIPAFSPEGDHRADNRLDLVPVLRRPV
ncbi:nitrilase-related carbon-nitrogen hydrolase [Actinomadura parmotrematis]|uniref:CN hydrolase domain-containing protein n=1 Tax=Actinomadura parmotrematis TaxID=2864039 RepID=A0ABS7G199_9ACTN|nr:nitrilase-related carbon-nitrogen hydrolase [Actinomadura parmotrematis]MBW8485423.1 hypothetical protein [Actinomadura parmotrematis]